MNERGITGGILILLGALALFEGRRLAGYREEIVAGPPAKDVSSSVSTGDAIVATFAENQIHAALTSEEVPGCAAVDSVVSIAAGKFIAAAVTAKAVCARAAIETISLCIA